MVVDPVIVEVVERRRALQLVGADGVVGGGEDDAGHAGPARGLEDVVGADQVRLQHRLPGRVDRARRGEVDDGVDAGAGGNQGVEIADIGDDVRVGTGAASETDRIEAAAGRAPGVHHEPADQAVGARDQHPRPGAIGGFTGAVARAISHSRAHRSALS